MTPRNFLKGQVKSLMFHLKHFPYCQLGYTYNHVLTHLVVENVLAK